ncbi:MAG: GNAT family N-acetyltransferase [Shewanella sp.]
MILYDKATQCTGLQQEYKLRVITPEDNISMAEVIRTVSAEYGLSADKGYSVADPSLDTLSEQYQASDACYWIIEKEGELLGGGGIAPLAMNTAVINTMDKPSRSLGRVCELQKMYFNQSLRGKGFAKRLTYLALDFAREQGFNFCYLETTAELNNAVKLYESVGFKHLDSRLGDTGHDACEIPMLLKL